MYYLFINSTLEFKFQQPSRSNPKQVLCHQCGSLFSLLPGGWTAHNHQKGLINVRTKVKGAKFVGEGGAG